VNTIKITPRLFEKWSNQYGFEYNKIPFSPTGYTIKDDFLPLSHTLAFFNGDFQYQGISSQLPVILLDVHPEQRILDMAAAPGSKSTQMAAIMHNSGELVLNDLSRNRLQALNVNMQRSGAVNFYILNIRGERLGLKYFEYFDKVLLDAPCSALGTLAGNPEVAGWWSLNKMDKLAKIQYHLLVSAIKALKIGGELVYSTCSVAPEENEMIIHEILKTYPVQIVAPPTSLEKRFNPGIIKYNGVTLNGELRKAIRVWPHIHEMEGFFAVKLRKLDSLEKGITPGRPQFRNTLDDKNPDIRDILDNLSYIWGIPKDVWHHYRYIITKTRIWMVASSIRQVLTSSFLSAGLLLAEKRLFGWKLSHSSAQVLSDFINQREIVLSGDELRILFNQGYIKVESIKAGYYALFHENQAIACVYVDDKKMSMRLPHSFNLIL